MNYPKPIAKDPMPEGIELSPVRKKVQEFLTDLIAKGEVHSKGLNDALFNKYGNMTHDKLQETWEREDKVKKPIRDAALAVGHAANLLTVDPKLKKTDAQILQNVKYTGLPTTTTCNGLTGAVSQHIRPPIGLGRFDLKEELQRQDCLEAWIPAGPGKRPKYGDICRFIKWHVGVSLYFVGDVWYTAECGQGGPGHDYKSAVDKCKFKRYPDPLGGPPNPAWTDTGILQGWVDLDILFRIGAKAPKWLEGWWIFEIGGKKEYVYIPGRGKSMLTGFPPVNAAVAPATADQVGRAEVAEDQEGVQIVWDGGAIDTLRHLPGVSYMLGERKGLQIQAYKMEGGGKPGAPKTAVAGFKKPGY